MVKKFLVRLMPDFMKQGLKKTYYNLVDAYDRVRPGGGMTPPKSMIFVGGGDFQETGQEFKRYFIEMAGVKPSSRVLDVGCGLGRMAVPLTDYLSEKGEYWGFDIVETGIRWCQRRISTKFRNFHFLHVDVKNKNYNATGKILAKDLQFPFEHESFDFVFLTSVFTHMFPEDVEQYMSEISRVLKKNAKCLVTFFLLNEESERLVRAGRSTLDFKYPIDGCLTIDKSNPESAIAYNEDHVRRLFEKLKLEIAEPINYGSWCKRDSFLSYQDIVIARKIPS